MESAPPDIADLGDEENGQEQDAEPHREGQPRGRKRRRGKRRGRGGGGTDDQAAASGLSAGLLPEAGAAEQHALAVSGAGAAAPAQGDRPVAQTGGSPEVTQVPPCAHNEWLCTDRRATFVTLRCLVPSCGARWKTCLDKFSKCADFHSEARRCPRGAACECPHVYARSRQNEAPSRRAAAAAGTLDERRRSGGTESTAASLHSPGSPLPRLLDSGRTPAHSGQCPSPVAARDSPRQRATATPHGTEPMTASRSPSPPRDGPARVTPQPLSPLRSVQTMPSGRPPSDAQEDSMTQHASAALESLNRIRTLQPAVAATDWDYVVTAPDGGTPTARPSSVHTSPRSPCQRNGLFGAHAEPAALRPVPQGPPRAPSAVRSPATPSPVLCLARRWSMPGRPVREEADMCADTESVLRMVEATARGAFCGMSARDWDVDRDDPDAHSVLEEHTGHSPGGAKRPTHRRSQTFSASRISGLRQRGSSPRLPFNGAIIAGEVPPSVWHLYACTKRASTLPPPTPEERRMRRRYHLTQAAAQVAEAPVVPPVRSLSPATSGWGSGAFGLVPAEMLPFASCPVLRRLSDQPTPVLGGKVAPGARRLATAPPRPRRPSVWDPQQPSWRNGVLKYLAVRATELHGEGAAGQQPGVCEWFGEVVMSYRRPSADPSVRRMSRAKRPGQIFGSPEPRCTQDFAVGMKIIHEYRGKGVVQKVNDHAIEVKFHSGDTHRYKDSSLVDGRLQLDPECGVTLDLFGSRRMSRWSVGGAGAAITPHDTDAE